MDTADRSKKIRRNIGVNAERSARNEAESKGREVTPEMRVKHRKLFEDAQYKTDRERNIKRGVR